MGYEDCLVLHVFTTDVNASLPGNRGHQIGCLKPFYLYKQFSFLVLDGLRVFASLNMTLPFELRLTLKFPLSFQYLFGSMAVVLLLGWLACMNLTSSWTTRYFFYFKHKIWGKSIAKINYKVVVVTVNYRLGPWGELSLDSGRVSGNQGLRDQVCLFPNYTQFPLVEGPVR